MLLSHLRYSHFHFRFVDATLSGTPQAKIWDCEDICMVNVTREAFYSPTDGLVQWCVFGRCKMLL